MQRDRPTLESGLRDDVTVERFEALDLPGRPSGGDRTPEEAAPAGSPVG